MKAILNNPLLNFVFFSYIINATWEWKQSPFYIDNTSTVADKVLCYTHCTTGDTIILLVGFALISLYNKSMDWIHHPKVKDYLVLVVFGVSYTFFSEYFNVNIKHNWSYSQSMPLVPFTNIGIIPLVQWIILPPIIVFITKRQIRA
jgi:hypothetical protein